MPVPQACHNNQAKCNHDQRCEPESDVDRYDATIEAADDNNKTKTQYCQVLKQNGCKRHPFGSDRAKGGLIDHDCSAHTRFELKLSHLIDLVYPTLSHFLHTLSQIETHRIPHQTLRPQTQMAVLCYNPAIQDTGTDTSP